MSHLEIKTANALDYAMEVIRRMMKQGIAQAKYFNVIADNIVNSYDLSKEQAIIIMEEAVKNI